ncbi:hypothetical protein [uncultured Victivallis sp.]|uniref:hypothetical protein n=1 Tax=uncultured Victivallis sp. TaxID=354118 RepID=UPI002596155F|nr:hypothetical protein [uncultured Victivallis sp.]
MKNAVFIPLEVLSQQKLPLYVKLVYGRIACRLGKNDRVVMTTDEIAMQCGITRRNAAKALPELVRLELVKHHESLDGRGLLRIFERKTPMERHDEPEKFVPPQAKEVLKKTEEN